MQKIQEVFLGFLMLNDFYQIIVHLNTLTHPLREKGIAFDWTEIPNETFKNLKLCVNSDNCFSYLEKFLYRVQFTPTLADMSYLDNTFTKINKK